MLKTFEASGKTVEEAVDNALALANTTIENVDIEVLEAGGRGVFGLGKKDARVRISLEVPDEKPARDNRRERQDAERERANRSGSADSPREDAGEDAPIVKELIRQRPADTAQAEAGPPKQGRRRNKNQSAPAAAATTKARERQPEAGPESAGHNYQLSPGSEAEVLAQTARAFLDPIFASLKVQPQQELQVKDGILWLIFSGPGLGSLIGRRGETLNSLQYLTNLAVNKERKEHARLVLDVEGYRAGREETLVTLAKKMADKAVRSGRRVELEPMNPHERRIVHMALQNDKRVDTLSQGEEPYRRVVITRHRQEGGAPGNGPARPEQRPQPNNQKRPSGPRGGSGGKSAPSGAMSLSQQLSRQFDEQLENRR